METAARNLISTFGDRYSGLAPHWESWVGGVEGEGELRRRLKEHEKELRRHQVMEKSSKLK